MATSGSKDFSVTRSQIIQAAIRKCGQADQGEPISAAEEQDAAFALNVLVKEWSARGIDIWLRDEITLFLQPEKESYQLGPSGDNVTASHKIGTLDGEEVLGSTSIAFTTVERNYGQTAATPAAVNDIIGIKTDAGSIHWATVTGITAISTSLGQEDVTSGATATIDSGLHLSASEGNAVYVYTTKADMPVRLVNVMRRNADGTDVPVEMIGEQEYRSLTRKQQEGPTTQVWFKQGLNSAELFVWPTGGNNGGYDRLVMQAIFHPDDFDAVSNEPEFPIEWANALIFHLAHDLAPEYGVDRQTRADLYAIAERKLREQLDFDVENASVVLSMDQRSQGAR